MRDEETIRAVKEWNEAIFGMSNFYLDRDGDSHAYQFSNHDLIMADKMGINLYQYAKEVLGIVTDGYGTRTNFVNPYIGHKKNLKLVD